MKLLRLGTLRLAGPWTRVGFGLLAATSLGTSTARAGILDWLLPKHDVHVIAVTDTTAAGALRRAATPQNPIYYVAVNAGYQDFGGTMAGDKIPPKETMMKVIAGVLAKQGYLPATEQHPPALVLFWTWGTMYTQRMPSFDPNDIDGQQINRHQLLRFMGGYKLGLTSKVPGEWQPELMPFGQFRDREASLVEELASEDLYVAAIGAYDFGAMQRSEKVLLWTTKISCPSRGIAMNEALPAMLALAGPHIGRETERPVSIQASETFKGEVKVGDATVVDFIDKQTLPVIEVPADEVKKARRQSPKKTEK